MYSSGHLGHRGCEAADGTIARAIRGRENRRPWSRTVEVQNLGFTDFTIKTVWTTDSCARERDMVTAYYLGRRSPTGREMQRIKTDQP
jgi:hypothetical protein